MTTDSTPTHKAPNHHKTTAAADVEQGVACNTSGKSTAGASRKRPSMMIRRRTPEENSESMQSFSTAAIWAIRFAIFADGLNARVLGPDYAIMVLPGGDPSSFPNTKPLGFSAAQYFIQMSAEIGMVISSLIFGYLSDRIGRKKCILACMYFGAIGSVLKYLARHNFWMFNAANFATGLLSGGAAAVGLAFVADVIPGRLKCDAEISRLTAVNLIGRTGGGVIAIAMQSVGLFAPLWVSAAICLMGGLICQIWMSNGQLNTIKADADTDSESESESDSGSEPLGEEVVGDSSSTASATKDVQDPEVLDKRALLTVMAGQLTDIIGSTGLVPLCLSPLMFNTYYDNFAAQNQDPIMSSTLYKVLYVGVAVIVVPAAAAAPYLFRKFGPALSAMFSNFTTAAVTIALLQIANLHPTTTMFAIFVAVLYLTFPISVISQLATTPMLDRIAPEAQRGEVQGYNMALMNFATAMGRFLLGSLSDGTSIDVCLYTTSAICVVSAIINYSLTKDHRLGPALKENEEGTSDLSSSLPPLPRLSSHVRTSVVGRSSIFMMPSSALAV